MAQTYDFVKVGNVPLKIGEFDSSVSKGLAYYLQLPFNGRTEHGIGAVRGKIRTLHEQRNISSALKRVMQPL